MDLVPATGQYRRSHPPPPPYRQKGQNYWVNLFLDTGNRQNAFFIVYFSNIYTETHHPINFLGTGLNKGDNLADHSQKM